MAKSRVKTWKEKYKSQLAFDNKLWGGGIDLIVGTLPFEQNWTKKAVELLREERSKSFEIEKAASSINSEAIEEIKRVSRIGIPITRYESSGSGKNRQFVEIEALLFPGDAEFPQAMAAYLVEANFIEADEYRDAMKIIEGVMY